MTTIIFDENAAAWTPNPGCNVSYLETQRVYLTDLLNYRGYIYLNQIYERLNIGWDPAMANTLYLRENGPLTIELEPVDDKKILIHII